MLLNNKSRTIKLIDFGLSRKIMPGAEVRISSPVPQLLELFVPCHSIGEGDVGHP